MGENASVDWMTSGKIYGRMVNCLYFRKNREIKAKISSFNGKKPLINRFFKVCVLKIKYKNTLDVEDGLRFYLSKLTSNIKYICKSK